MTRTSKKDVTKGDKASTGVIESRAQASSDAHSERAPTVAAVCLLIEGGKTSLRKACGEVGVDPATFLRWCDADDEFAKQYARAREVGDELDFEELAEMAGEPAPVTAMGSTDAGWVAWNKLRIDTQKWMLAKRRPTKYGDKQQIEHSGGISLESLVAGNDAGE